MLEKIFKAYDVRALYPNPLNADAAWRVGHATARFLRAGRASADAGKPADAVKLPNTMLVGRDMRPHSPELANALSDGIRAAGMDVIDVGMIDTSFIYFAINHVSAAGGIMVTASHNPVQYNGLKISGAKAKPIGSATGLNDIKRIALELNVGPTGQMGKLESVDLWPAYRKHVLQFLNLKRPLKVAIDASNGMAGKMVPAVFGGIPGLTIVPILFEITGSFVHEPNPLVEANLDMLKKKIAQSKTESPPVDFGACFDGDADRCMFVDDQSKAIGSDIITALLARDFLQLASNKGAAIVYDLRSSHVVPDEILANGGVPKRDRVGHAFIKKTMADANAVFGGELSGHLYFRDNFFADSAAIAFARALSIVSAQPLPLSQLVKPLYKYSHSGEINFHVEDKEAKIRELAQKFQDAKIDYLDGITVDYGNWWFNVRQSNTEPMLRLNLEAGNPAMLKQKLHELQCMLGEPVQGH